VPFDGRYAGASRPTSSSLTGCPRAKPAVAVQREAHRARRAQPHDAAVDEPLAAGGGVNVPQAPDQLRGRAAHAHLRADARAPEQREARRTAAGDRRAGRGVGVNRAARVEAQRVERRGEAGVPAAGRDPLAAVGGDAQRAAREPCEARRAHGPAGARPVARAALEVRGHRSRRRRPAARALERGLEEAQPGRRHLRVVDGVVGGAVVAEVAELERHRRAAVGRSEQVVQAHALAGREQVVGPAGLDQQPRRAGRRAHADRAVEAVQLRERRADVAAVGLAALEALLPGREVGGRLGTRRRDEPRARGRRREQRHPRLQLDADRRGVRCGPEAPVREQRVGEVAPRPARVRGRQRQAPGGRARPRRARTVRQHDAVAQHRELQRLAAAVGDAGGAERVGARDALVDEQPEEVLHVADLEALVGEVHPPARAVRGARVRHAARAPEAARARHEHRVAGAGVARGVGGEVGLRAGEGVQHRRPSGTARPR
jgi:hypothetical protein